MSGIPKSPSTPNFGAYGNNTSSKDNKSSGSTSSFGQFSGFGNKPSPWAFGKPQASNQPSDPLRERLNALKNSGDPKSKSYQYGKKFYSIGKEGTTTTSSSSMMGQDHLFIDNEEWQSRTDSPNTPYSTKFISYVPIAIKGFSDLEKHINNQKEIISKVEDLISVMKAEINSIRIANKKCFKNFEELEENNKNIHIYLMEIKKVEEVKEIQQNHDYQFTQEEKELLDKLELIDSQIKSNIILKLKHRSRLNENSDISQEYFSFDFDKIQETKLKELIEKQTNSIKALSKQTKILSNQTDILIGKVFPNRVTPHLMFKRQETEKPEKQNPQAQKKAGWSYSFNFLKK